MEETNALNPIEELPVTVPEQERQSESVLEPNFRLIQFLVEDKSIPKHIRKDLFWAFSDKEMSLSNLTEKDIERVLTGMNVAYNYYLMSKPDYEHTWKDDIDFRQLRMKVFVKLKRSQDGFERKLDATQIRVSQIEEGQIKSTGGGIGGRLGKFFRGVFGT